MIHPDELKAMKERLYGDGTLQILTSFRGGKISAQMMMNDMNRLFAEVERQRFEIDRWRRLGRYLRAELSKTVDLSIDWRNSDVSVILSGELLHLIALATTENVSIDAGMGFDSSLSGLTKENTP